MERAGRRRAGSVLLAGVLAAGLVAVGLRLGAELTAPDCTVVVGGETVELSAAQARDATTLAAVTRRDGRTQADLARALPAALDDAPGDLTPAAAGAVLRPRDGAVDPQALSLGRALLGYGTDRLACRAGADDVVAQAEGAGGLTARADTTRDAVLEAFGRLPLGGFAPGGVRAGHIEGSAHYEGRAVDVFFRPVSDQNRRRGWTTAQYLAAHADRLDVDVLIFDRRLWSSSRSAEGWRPYRHPSGDSANPVLNHLDHVHVDVLEGA